MKSNDVLKIFSVALTFMFPLASHCQPQEGAKSLFYRQISSPSLVLNTGMQYWIELKRGGQVSKVSNKFSFKSGDSIRIHVKSNTDAYAYVVLLEGSGGEQSVLFPDSRYHDNPKIKASVDYPLPGDGYLKFDSNPGTEKLILLVSRKPIDANKYLSDKSKKHVVIASAKPGSKDLIPGSVVLAYSNEDDQIAGLPSDKPAAENPVSAKPAIQKPLQEKKNEKAPHSNSTDVVTTLVQKDPEQVLAVDMALAHFP